jgi:imidazolonepropionase-like amidohydrolase
MRSTVVRDVTVISGTGLPAMPNMAIVITGARIAVVDRADRVQIPADARIIEGRGKFVIPGLADAHNHLAAGGPTPRFQDLKPNLRQLLSWGVTSAFSMSTDSASFAELKKVSAEDQAPYARFYGVGAGFATFGGPRPNTPEAARDAVRKLTSEHVDAVKIAYDDMSWAVTQPIPVLRRDVVSAIISEAHALGLKAYIHAPLLKYAKETLRDGADGLIHGVISEPVDDEFIELMKHNRALYVSTLSLFEACADIRGWTRRLAEFDQRGAMRQMWEIWENPASAEQFESTYNRTAYIATQMPVLRVNLKRLAEAGVPIVTGTDTGFPGVVLGVSSLMEVVLHVEAGLTPQAAIQSATFNASRMVGREQDLGTVESGKLADLVVLDADPLVDIFNLRRIHRVIKGGVVFEP